MEDEFRPQGLQDDDDETLEHNSSDAKRTNARTTTVQVACEPCRKKTERKKRGPKPGGRSKRKAISPPSPNEYSPRKDQNVSTESSSDVAGDVKEPASASESISDNFNEDTPQMDAEYHQDAEEFSAQRAAAKRRYQRPLIVPHTVLTELSTLRTYMEGYRKSVWPASLSPPRPVETILESDDAWEMSCSYATLALGARTQGNLPHANEFIQKACILINADQGDEPHFMRLAALNAISFFYKSNCDFATALHYNRFARELAQHLLRHNRDTPWPDHVKTSMLPHQKIHLRHLCLDAICNALTMGHEDSTMSLNLFMSIAPVLAEHHTDPHDILFDRFVKAICIMPALATTPPGELHKVEQPLRAILDEIQAVAKAMDCPAVVVRWFAVVNGMMALIHLLRNERKEAIHCADLVVSLLIEKGPAYYDMNTCVAVFWVAQVHMRLDWARYTWDMSLLSEMAKFAKMAFFIAAYLRVLERDVPLFNQVPYSVTSIPVHIYPPDPTSAAAAAAATASSSSNEGPTKQDVTKSPVSTPEMPLAVPPKPLDAKTMESTVLLLTSDPKVTDSFQTEKVASIGSAATEYLAVYNNLDAARKH